MSEDSVRFSSDMFAAITTTWMLAAVTCAALPFLHAVPQLQAFGQLAILLTALGIGVAVAVPLSLAARHLCDLGAHTKNSWALFAPREAAFLGIIGWGVPVGLIFALQEFLASSNVVVVIPSLVIWPVGGVAFGLLMQWFGRRA
jgi:hypothetical protein